MSILNNFSKVKRYRKTDFGYKLQSQWTSSETVEMNDGNSLEANLGSIKGITDSLSSEDSNVTLSSKAGKDLQDQITTINNSLSGLSLVLCTQTEYDALSEKAANTLYFITEG